MVSVEMEYKRAGDVRRANILQVFYFNSGAEVVGRVPRSGKASSGSLSTLGVGGGAGAGEV
jgi:hypothetical protein